jgi:transketolase
LAAKSREIRATCIQLCHDGGESHLNGALSSVDILVALFYHGLNISPDNRDSDDRDRFIFSKGHACTALYAVLADVGIIAQDLLRSYARSNSPLPSHPCVHMLPALEWSSGSLGHGLGVGSGMAYGLKLRKSPGRVVVLLSDGECNEGSTWEAAMFSAANRLDNLLAIIDYNGTQSIGFTDDLTGHTSFAAKFRAFGWAVEEVDGHNIQDLIASLDRVPFQPGKPSAVVARTKAGAGVSFMENTILWHYRTPTEEDVTRALEELQASSIYGRREQ